MFSIFRPFIFSLDPETAHDLAINSLKFNVLPKNIFQVENEELLETNLFNEKIPNPIGLAAGLIKALRFIILYLNLAMVLWKLEQLLQKNNLGNPRPRIFRLEKDQALINRLGFNNHGSEIVSKRISKNLPNGFLGINIGPNKETKKKKRIIIYVYLRLASMPDI